jgi:hypothetical protein
MPSKRVAFEFGELEEGIEESPETYQNDTSRALNRVTRRESQIYGLKNQMPAV